ncbi:MAG: response regulator [Gammaproteobacteria bacterium]|nr:response regulator [Gammaproteobacteria bacterium]
MEQINLDYKKAHILIVDDEATNIKLVNQTLFIDGYENIYSTQVSTEVFDLCKQQQFDLILLDINMPELDGFGVLSQLNNELNELPSIIMLTAQNMQEYKQKALDEGALDYVTKPFDIRELLSRVRNMIQVHLANKYMKKQNEILEREVKKRTEEIHHTRLQVVRRLGMAAEYRDNETGMHIIRMSKMSEALARAAGEDENFCDLLLNAAPMHDIGKIGIPDHILLKPGKFEPDEWEIMKTHTIIGAKILSEDDSELMNLAHDIALSHHEKWDGTGYPNGLKEKEISLASRITSIADVFDALTSKRPYKKAWTVDAAIELVKKESGSQFDPNLVDIFVENLSKMISIRNEFPDIAETKN